MRIGEASERFPVPWIVTSWVPDVPGDRATITRGHHAAETLADFLRTLHQPAPDDAPVNPKRGALETLSDEFDRMSQATGSDGDVAAVRKALG
jgi:hypothetical protein